MSRCLGKSKVWSRAGCGLKVGHQVTGEIAYEGDKAGLIPDIPRPLSIALVRLQEARWPGWPGP